MPVSRVGWPRDVATLHRLQERLAGEEPPPWRPSGDDVVGGSYVCFARGSVAPGRVGQRGWAGAAAKTPGERSRVAVVTGTAAATYVPGDLALREGPLRAAAVLDLSRRPDSRRPDVVIVDAAGRDHPRGAGLALHLGADLEVASVGVTDRPLAAEGGEPLDRRGATCPLHHRGRFVGYRLRTRPGARPVTVSAGWRTTAEVAVEVVLSAARKARTPQPLREARRAARDRRARDGG